VSAEQTASRSQELAEGRPISLGLTPAELKDYAPVITVVPIVASGFAVAYNVGFFLAYDISWLPFFSLSEHVVFALRALPVAIAASVVFMIGVIEGSVFWYRALWIGVLVIAMLKALVDAHFGLSLVFLYLACRAIRHHVIPLKNQCVNILYCGASVMLLSLVVGYLSGISGSLIWEIEKNLGLLNHPRLQLLIAPSMCFDLTPPPNTVVSKSGPKVGRVIFVGSNGVLFHEYGSFSAESDRFAELFRPKARLFKKNDIQNVRTCSDSELQAFANQTAATTTPVK
jgi:hypothetical protein